MTIAMLCPTKGRPQQFKRMVESAVEQSESNLLICVGLVDEHCTTGPEGSATNTSYYDDFLDFACGIVDKANRRVFFRQARFPDGLPTAQKWNLLAEMALGNEEVNLFMLAADDMVFATPLWDRALIDHYNSLENKIHVYALRDSRDENGTPHIIVTREYIEAMGYFVPPIFLHWFVDSWTVEIAKSVGCFTHLKDYMLVHNKPSDRGEGDETHNNIRNMGWHERDKWVAETMQHVMFHEGYRLRSVIEGMTNPGSIPLLVKK